MNKIFIQNGSDIWSEVKKYHLEVTLHEHVHVEREINE